MNRPLLKKLQPAPGNLPSPDVQNEPQQSSGRLITEALNLIKLITNGRRAGLPEAEVPDVTQETLLRLWKWLQKFRDKSDGMSAGEWSSFTARSTYNEIGRHRKKLIRNNEVPLEDVPDIQNLAQDFESDMEMASLIRKVWQGICKLSLYQRRALLLHSAELLIYLMQFGIREQDLAEALSFKIEDWRVLAEQMPLADIEIAKLINGSRSPVDTKSAVGAIKKARYDARRKLGKLKR